MVMIIFMIIINDNQLSMTSSCPVIPLMNFTSSVRELSALIILVNDTLRGKPMIHRHGRTQPCYVTAINALVIEYLQWSSLVREINRCKPLIHTVYLNMFFLWRWLVKMCHCHLYYSSSCCDKDWWSDLNQ